MPTGLVVVMIGDIFGRVKVIISFPRSALTVMHKHHSARGIQVECEKVGYAPRTFCDLDNGDAR